MCVPGCFLENLQNRSEWLRDMAGTTGLEPAASAVTGQRSNQLNYVPNLLFLPLSETRVFSGFPQVQSIRRFARRNPV